MSNNLYDWWFSSVADADDLKIRLLALCIWREARGEPQEARVAVGKVIVNRCRIAPLNGFCATIPGNILKPFAFSSFNRDDPNASKYPPEFDEPVWSQCLIAAASAMDPVTSDLSNGAVFYFSPPLTSPPSAWGSVVHTADVGRLHFYRIAGGAL
jgi:spore germination cell wall hydrolase CwlJ-like protein